MTVTKFSIEFHSRGDLNDSFARMITNHNEGKANITLDLFEWYAKGRKAEFVIITPKFEFVSREADNSLHVYENGKATVSIWEKVILELDTVETEGENLEQKSV